MKNLYHEAKTCFLLADPDEKLERSLATASEWDAGQLEAEMLANTWLTVPATPDVIFDVPFADRWSVAAGTLGIDISQISPDAGHA